MQGIPQPVHDVTVWPHISWPAHGGVGPVIPAVIENASGTYAVGTLNTYANYNLNLDDATAQGGLQLGGLYTASVTYENGTVLNTPVLTCTNDSGSPQFGATVDLLNRGGSRSVAPAVIDPAAHESLIPLEPVVDVGITASHPPSDVVESVMTDGTGTLVSTQTGTPHLMGYEVQGDTSRLGVGMDGLTVSARNADTGELSSLSHLTCRSVDGDRAVLLQTFP